MTETYVIVLGGQCLVTMSGWEGRLGCVQVYKGERRTLVGGSRSAWMVPHGW